jgi:hypothetical protein
MKKQLRLSVMLALGLAAVITQGASARVISTFDPGGADAEVREAAPTTPRGEMNELGMRIAATAHNGHVYMKFGVQDVTASDLAHPITMRTTWALSNMAANRIFDIADLVAGDFQDRQRASFDYYVLNPNHGKANWDEATLIYGTTPATWAPGLTFDGNFETKDLLVNASGAPVDSGNLTYLGNNVVRSLYRTGTDAASLVIENRLPIGENFDMTFAPGSPLHEAIVAAQATGHQTVTLVTTLHFDTASANNGWLNFNYVWNPKERNPLNTDTAYDSNTQDPNNPTGAPLGGSANTAENPFAPRLIFVPEPASLVLFGLCGMAGLLRRWA